MSLRRHALTFRGTDATIPAGTGLCRACGALFEIEEWLTTECPKGDRDARELPAIHGDAASL